MAPTPHAARDTQRHEYWIEAGLDYGTSTVKVCYTVMQDGVPLAPPAIIPLQNQKLVPSVVAWHGSVHGQPKKFYWGMELLDKVEQGIIPADRIIQHGKLALYEGFARTGTSSIVDRVHEQLRKAVFSLDEMPETHLQHIFIALRARICQTYFHSTFDEFAADFLLKMPIRARCTIPHTFGPVAGRRLRVALMKAGAAMVTVASEQICALAAYIVSIILHMFGLRSNRVCRTCSTTTEHPSRRLEEIVSVIRWRMRDS